MIVSQSASQTKIAQNKTDGTQLEPAHNDKISMCSPLSNATSFHIFESVPKMTRS